MNDENCFTKVFLEKFKIIEVKTIKALLSNGFTSKELLLFLDLDKDLPDLDIPLAQRGLLRKILTELKESQSSTNLLKSFEKKLSEELLEIDDNCEQKDSQTAKQESSQSPEKLSKLTPIPSSVSDQFFPAIPSTSRELVPVASTSSYDCYSYIPSTVHPMLSIPSSSGHNFGSFRQLNLLSLPSTSRLSLPPINRPPKLRRFVKIIKRKKRINTCDKSTDSRYYLNPDIKTEDIIPIIDLELNNSEPIGIKSENETQESNDNKCLKTTTIEQSMDAISEENQNTVPNTVPNVPQSNVESEESKQEEIGWEVKTRRRSGRRKNFTPKRKSPIKRSLEDNCNNGKRVSQSTTSHLCLFNNCDKTFTTTEELRLHRNKHIQDMSIVTTSANNYDNHSNDSSRSTSSNQSSDNQTNGDNMLKKSTSFDDKCLKQLQSEPSVRITRMAEKRRSLNSSQSQDSNDDHI